MRYLVLIAVLLLCGCAVRPEVPDMRDARDIPPVMITFHF